MKLREFCRVHKRKMIVTAVVSVLLLAVGTAGVIYYLHRKNAGGFPFWGGGSPFMGEDGSNAFQGMNQMLADGAVSASGLTSAGMTQESFEVEGLSGILLVEEVYISSGDELHEGDKILKLSQVSVEEARRKLEKDLRAADLAYRAGAIEYEQNKIQAKYDRDMAVLEGEQAKAVYEETLNTLSASVEQARQNLDETNAQIAEYREMLGGDLYENCKVKEYKELYDENLKLLMDKMEEWNVSWQQVVSGSGSAGQNGTGNTGSTGQSGMGQTGMGNMGGTDQSGMGSMGNGSPSGGGTSLFGLSEEISGTETDIPEEDSGADSIEYLDESPSAGEKTEEELSEEPAKDTEEENNPSTGERPEGGHPDTVPEDPSGDAVQENPEETQVIPDSSQISVLQSLYRVLEQNLADYEAAQETYENAAANAQLELQTLELSLSSLQEALQQAQENYDTQVLQAKLTYEKSLSGAQRAESDYETVLEKAGADYEALRDAKEDAEKNLALFESRIGDGYYYAPGNGSVLRMMAGREQYLNSEDVILTYNNSEEMIVTVTVNQSDIASVSVGEEAYVISSDSGSFSGIVTKINPVSNSDSRTNVTYEVTVTLEGNVGNLQTNKTVTVIFGLGGNR